MQAFSMVLEKLWHASLLLDKFSRNLAVSTRQTQKKLQKAAGFGCYADLFRQADLLCLAIRSALEGIQCEEHNPSTGEDDPLTEHDPWASPNQCITTEEV